jgi:acyl-CoA synthetase (AMP-forming)/AMP-acid ligase II
MSFRSPFQDVDISDTSVYECVFGGIEAADLDRVALVDAASGVEITYGETIARVDAFAGALTERGIGVGDVVAILSPNSPAFVIVLHGILRAGATVTTVNALSTAGEIAKQISDSGARMLVTIAPLLERAEKAAAATGMADADVVVFDNPGADDGPAIGAHPNTSGLLASDRPAPATQATFDPTTHLAALPYSSGTTGIPKGVMLTHRNLVANLAQIRPIHGMTPADVALGVVPFVHIYGMTVLMNAALQSRSRLVIMAKFDLAEFLASIQKYRCTQGYIVPPVALALAKHPMVDSYDLSSLRTLVSGAAPLDADLARAVEVRVGCRIVQGYGMTEMSPVSHAIPFDGGQRLLGGTAPLGSCGWTVPNSVSKLVDPETSAEIDLPEQGRSAVGELWFKGPNVMTGYLNNEKATSNTIDADGFMHTGDLACVDADGCVYLVDRLKELIKYKGYQVPPAELEALLLTHPGIADAAVIGVADDSGGEIPKAFIVKGSAALTDIDVMAFVAARVAPYKRVRQVEFIEVIPKSAAGKILRKDLKSTG